MTCNNLWIVCTVSAVSMAYSEIKKKQKWCQQMTIYARYLLTGIYWTRLIVFVTLGHPSLVMLDAECSKEIQSRLGKGQNVSAALKRIWQSRDVAGAMKVVLIRALVWPVAVHGCTSWTVLTGNERRIQTFEMRGLRQILYVCHGLQSIQMAG